MSDDKESNVVELDRARLLNDQEFADLMEAELRAEGAAAVTSIDEIAKQRNWNSITTRIDKSKKTSLSWPLIASIAAVLIAVVGTTFFMQQGLDSQDSLDGIKGVTKAGSPVSVSVFRVASGEIYVPITDGAIQKNSELAFRTSASLPSYTAILVVPNSGPIELFLNDSLQSPPDEPIVVENGTTVLFRFSSEISSATVCAVAADTATEVQQLAMEIKSHPTPLSSGLLDPESACTKVVVTESAP